MSEGDPKAAAGESSGPKDAVPAEASTNAPGAAPSASAEPSAAPAASVEPSAAPAASAEPSAAPAASVEPSAASAASVEPSAAPAASAEPSAAPAASAEPSAAPAASAASAASAEPSAASAASAQVSATSGSALDELPGIHVHLYGQTDVGLVREHNEDNFLVVDITASVRGVDERLLKHTLGARGSLFAVCDGMGGAAAGEIASQMAVDTLHEVMTSGDVPATRDDFARRLVSAVEEAGSRIFSAAKMDRTRRGMGTTSTVVGAVDKMLFVGQVGDSRAYALRGGRDFALITKDQSLVNQLIEAGQLTEEEAGAFEHSNIILQALGTAEQVTVDLTFLELRRGDRVMLCSDGLSGLVHAEMIKDVLATVPEPRACCATLIEMARAGGGHDNITVIVADFHGADLAPPDDTSRVAYQQYPLPDAPELRDSVPAREIAIKAGGPKPGSEVKSDPYAHRRARPVKHREATKRWMWPVIALVLAVLAVAIFLVAGMVLGWPGFSERDHDAQRGAVRESTASSGVGEAPVPAVEVRVVSDVRHGDLWIDGARRMSLNPGGTTLLELPPGAYALEARTSEGASAATASLTVVAGAPVEVDLSIPAGTADTLGDGLGDSLGGPISGVPSGAPNVVDAQVPSAVLPARPAGGVSSATSDGGIRRPRRLDGGASSATPDGGIRRPRRLDGGASSGPRLGTSGGIPPRPRDHAGSPPPGPLPDNPFAN